MRKKSAWAASAVLGALSVAYLFIACSGGDSTTARFGTPAWYWQAAQENFRTGDFAKTDEHLTQIVKSDSEWKQRAAAWQVVLLTGLVRGNADMAEVCKDGMEENKASINALRNPLRQYQRDARQYTVELLESWKPLEEAIGDGETVPLDLPFPVGSAAESPLLGAIRSGVTPDAARLAEATTDTLKRNVLLELTEYVGAGEDVPKAQGMFNTPPVQVPAVEFWNQVADSLFERSSLFGEKEINVPAIRKIMLERALDALSGALASDNEDLKKSAEEKKEEIEKELKKIKA